MAQGPAIKLTGAWGAFAKAMDPQVFRPRLERQLMTANERIGRQFQARARRLIRSGAYAPNSPLTVILKGSSKPLVDKGDLFQAITFDLPSPYMVRVGVFRAKAGDQLVNLGAILHEGATIDVQKHPGVRAKVWSLVRSAIGNSSKLRGASRAAVVGAATSIGMSKGGKAKPKLKGQALKRFFASQPKTGGPAKKVWVIPGRPFIAQPLSDPTFRNFALEQWSRAVRATFLGMAPGAGGT